VEKARSFQQNGRSDQADGHPQGELDGEDESAADHGSASTPRSRMLRHMARITVA
jgi:hypothetical protein